MPDQDRNKRFAEATRKKMLAMAGATITDIPGYDDNALTQGATALAKSLSKGKETMGGSAERTESDFQMQRAGEREDMSQFGDDKEKMGMAMARSLMGSKKFTKGEVRRGYRRLG